MVMPLPLRHFSVGDVIFREGDAPDAVYVIATGKVEISKAGRPLAMLERDGIFGDMALIDHRPRSATATALSDVECYVIEMEKFDRLMDNIDPVLQAIYKILVGRLRMMTQMVTLS